MSFVAAVRGFAGEITGSVVSKREERIVVEVKDVSNLWRGNRAENAETLVGTRIVVVAGDNANVKRFLELVETGEEIRLDLAHREGERFQLVELNADQRERIQR